MTADLQLRCDELLAKGRELAKRIPVYEGKPHIWYRAEDVPELQAWIGSAANFFRLIATPDTYFHLECKRVLEDERLSRGMPAISISKLLGLLQSASEEMAAGLMRKAEYVFVATTFDNFLDHASEYHKTGKKIESSVLASAVFEDSVRKLAQKNTIAEAGRSMESLIDNLAQNGVLTSVKAKRIKSIGGVRNKALHAQWGEFDIRDVGDLISGTRELLEML
jgi:ribosomal protein S20